MLFRKASARRASGLDGLEFLSSLDAAAYLIDDLPERRSHRHLNESHIVDLAGKGEHLCSLGFLRAD